jgi:hypothetical protein
MQGFPGSPSNFTIHSASRAQGAEATTTLTRLVAEGNAMTKIEIVAEEITVETTEQAPVELSLAELDMIGGGNAISTNW